MSIFSRLTDIINANLNALLEKAEDPVKIVRMMIQEMEDTLVEIRSDAARTIAEKKERARKINWLNDEIDDWASKAELALNKGREDLARAALSEKRQLTDKATAIQEEMTHLDVALQKFNEDINKLEVKLTDARNRQQKLMIRENSARAQLKTRSQVHNPKLDDVLHRFEAAERKIDAVESESEAMEMGQKKTLVDAFADLETDDTVNEELEAMKARMKQEQEK